MDFGILYEIPSFLNLCPGNPGHLPVQRNSHASGSFERGCSVFVIHRAAVGQALDFYGIEHNQKEEYVSDKGFSPCAQAS
jgi:hypothetical protein